MMLVDDKHLQTRIVTADRGKTKVSPDELHQILTIGNSAIRGQIESIYQRNYRPDAEIHRPSIWVAQMIAKRHDDSVAYSELGLAENTGILSTPFGLNDPYREYWNAIRDAGFVAESRRSYGGRHAGAWLLARVDPTP